MLDEHSERIGLRRCRWIAPSPPAKPGRMSLPTTSAASTMPPDPESHFVFVVNNEPIMVKGSNWVPLDAFHSRDAARYEQAVALFADLGCNMIRCWGGNVYEDHRFYDLCDEQGIMVWQDMAFACAIYPQSRGLPRPGARGGAGGGGEAAQPCRTGPLVRRQRDRRRLTACAACRPRTTA